MLVTSSSKRLAAASSWCCVVQAPVPRERAFLLGTIAIPLAQSLAAFLEDVLILPGGRAGDTKDPPSAALSSRHTRTLAVMEHDPLLRQAAMSLLAASAL